MFLQFYGLKEQPFNVTPDPRFLYLSPSHREAIASLYCAIENGRGFSVMVAKPGMGKTSILFRLLETFGDRARTAFLFQSDCNSRQLLQSLMLDIGLEVTDDVVRMRESLNRLLLEERRAGRRFVIVLDEAQNLDADVLESIRLLSNFETPTEKLLHFVLAGQPQLAATLAKPEMVQLSQRVSAAIGLVPFSIKETREYIRHRLSVAGRNGSEVFTEDAYELIARLSEGIPRNISNICFQAMSVGCALRSKKIHPGIVAEVANDLCSGAGSAPVQQVSAGAPFARPWIMPEVPLWSPAPLWVSRQKHKALKFCLAGGALALSSFFGWQTLGSRLKLDLGSKPNVIRPAADSKIPSAIPTNDPAATTSAHERVGAVSASSTASGEVDKSSMPIDTPAPPQNPTGGKAVSANQSRSTHLVQVKQIAQGRSHLNSSKVAKRGSFPRVIVIERSESLFQVALENYGRSSRELVYRIQVENPSLKDPFMVLLRGQRVVLPDVPATEVAGRKK